MLNSDLMNIKLECLANKVDDIIQMIDKAEGEQEKENILLYVFGFYEVYKQIIPEQIYLLLIINLLNQRKAKIAKILMAECIKKYPDSFERLGELNYSYFIYNKDKEYQQRFENNLALIQKNRVFFGSKPLDFSEAKKRITEFASEPTVSLKDLPSSSSSFNFILFVDYRNLATIKQLLEKNFSIYLVFENMSKLFYLLCYTDLAVLNEYIVKQRLLIFDATDYSVLFKIFSNPMILLPFRIVNGNQKHYDLVNNFAKGRKELQEQYTNQIKEIYKYKNNEYYKRLFLHSSNKVKILIVSSKHTHVNQYICSNWKDALDELGYNVEFLIEKEFYEFNNYQLAMIEKIASFEPDIVFHINFTVGDLFKDDFIRKSLLWIMRHRDYNPYEDIGISYENNLWILPITKQQEQRWINANFPTERLLYTSDGVSIKKFNINRKYNFEYDCDITFVSNSGHLATDEELKSEFRGRFKEENNIFNQAVKMFPSFVHELEEQILIGKSVFFEYTIISHLNYWLDTIGLEMEYSTIKSLAFRLATHLVMFNRQKELEWIIESGITKNIKIWGRGWSESAKFAPYHMGVAENGEQLASIYYSSKIALSNQNRVPLHERNFEILASGGFPLVKYTDPEGDDNLDLLTNYFCEDKDIAIYHDKDDMINKIQYYLDHPEERKKVSARGLEIVRSLFSDVAIAKRTMDFIKSYYLKGE